MGELRERERKKVAANKAKAQNWSPMDEIKGKAKKYMFKRGVDTPLVRGKTEQKP